MDLAGLDTGKMAEGGAWLELAHPVGRDALGVRLCLAGADSQRYRAAQRRLVEKRIRRRGVAVTPEEAEADAVALLAECTLAWEGVVVDGESVACCRDEAERLYGRFPWIKEQVDAFVGERANFLPA